MKSILNSASKLVFVLLAASVCIGFFIGKLDPKDFVFLTGMAFSFYFGISKPKEGGNGSNGNPSDTL